MVTFVEKVRLTIEAQKQKYRRKGVFNAILSWILLFFTIWSLREIALKCWPTDLQPQDRVNFVMKVSLIIHISCEIGYFMLFLPGYLGISSFHDRHLINRESKRHWERQNWPELRLRTFKILFINSLLIYPTVVVVGLKYGSIGFRFDNFPGFWEIFLQVTLLWYIQDIFQYFFHRMFHDVNFLYRTLHKVHHEHDTPYVLAADFGHPIENFIVNTVPPTLMFMIVSSHMHIYTSFFWTIFKAFGTKQSHSGYEFHFTPTRILPFVASSHYHDFHHSKNVGNFAGSVYIWDTFLSGTPANQPYFDMLTAQEQKEQKEREYAKKVN